MGIFNFPFRWFEAEIEIVYHNIVSVNGPNVRGFRNAGCFDKGFRNSSHPIYPEGIRKSLFEILPILFCVGFVVADEDYV